MAIAKILAAKAAKLSTAMSLLEMFRPTRTTVGLVVLGYILLAIAEGTSIRSGSDVIWVTWTPQLIILALPGWVLSQTLSGLDGFIGFAASVFILTTYYYTVSVLLVSLAARTALRFEGVKLRMEFLAQHKRKLWFLTFLLLITYLVMAIL